EEREMRVKSNVVVVSEAFARQYFPNGDAIGQKVVIDMSDKPDPTEIVGIVGNVRFENLTTESRPSIYWPHPQLVYSAMTFVLRTDGDPRSLAASLEAAGHAGGQDTPLAGVRPMEQGVGPPPPRGPLKAQRLAIFGGAVAP